MNPFLLEASASCHVCPRNSPIMTREDGFQAWADADDFTRSRLFEFTIEHANDPILITTTELASPGPHIVYTNRAFTQMTGYTREEAVGQTPRMLQGPLTSREEMARMRRELERGHSFVGETMNYRKDGTPYDMEWSVHGLCDEAGTLHFYVAVQRDISSRKGYERRLAQQARELESANAELARANARLAALSYTDSLTGVANHRAFHARLNDELKRAKRYSTPLSLLMIDVDRFKSYNDTFGHPAGDVALQCIAHLLQTHTRTSDLVARLGGEELAVLLPQTDHDGAFARAELLRQAIERYPWPLRPVTASIGIATSTTEDNFTLPLVQHADAALYRSKANGRNRIS